MSVILVTNRSGRTKNFSFGGIQATFLVGTLITALAGAAYLGAHLAKAESVAPSAVVEKMERELAAQRAEVEKARLNAEEHMNALAVQLGQMKAHVIRLDALGQRLIEKAKLNKGEFDFESAPGLGGPSETTERGQTIDLNDFMAQFKELDQQLEHRSLQLGVLESMLMNRDLHDEVFPQGRPVKSGWVSSYFGKRTDPFNGRIAHHDGIDIAGEMGSDVIAVAAGVVTWAGKRYGYGNLVEINHGNGYVTRYAHNRDIHVKLGETVKKGQTLAAMGSSGRSTGPHVHFEVIRNGKVVDPMRYIRASR